MEAGGQALRRRRLQDVPGMVPLRGERADVLALDYSRVEIAAAARRRLMSCTQVQRLGCNDADVVRSARLEGKRC